MSFIQFESGSEKERVRQQIHAAREELLKRVRIVDMYSCIDVILMLVIWKLCLFLFLGRRKSKNSRCTGSTEEVSWRRSMDVARCSRKNR